jgi:hypothetical protein
VRMHMVSDYVHWCITPPQGYTQSDQRPLGKARANISRIDRRGQTR